MKEVKLGSLLIGTPVAFLLGDWTPLYDVLLVMIGLDLITGITKGFYKKELRSRHMHQGIIRKTMIIVVVIVANMIDVALFGSTPVCKTSVLLFFIGMEGISLLENLAQMDIPLPDFISKYLMVIKDKAESMAQPVEEVTIKKDDAGITIEATPIDPETTPQDSKGE